EQADALVHAGLLTLDALIGVEAEDLADIPGLADQAESVQAAARAEKERRAGSTPNPLTGETPAAEEPTEPAEDSAPETGAAAEATPTKEAE
ncbi:MAG: hypothetical protein VX509_08660, partial [Verrucomicrobiota bacterium]|nr:hypothetical protein [Verrucomicrobiota bacterium]